MKAFKIFTLSIIIICFTSIHFTAQAADCSDYKKFSHKWNKCKLGTLKEIGSGESGKETTSTTNDDSSKTEKESGVLGGILDGLKKIREFGGKNVGEAG